MSKGDIVLIDFPFTDLSDFKMRPALVLYSDEKSEDCVFAFITSEKPKKLIEFDVKLRKSKYNGLKNDSIIKLDRIATLNKKMASRYLGKLDSDYVVEVDNK